VKGLSTRRDSLERLDIVENKELMRELTCLTTLPEVRFSKGKINGTRGNTLKGDVPSRGKSIPPLNNGMGGPRASKGKRLKTWKKGRRTYM